MPISAHMLLPALVVSALIAPVPSSAAPYKFDGKRGEVRFAYSLPFSNGLGRFTGVSGRAEVNDAAPEKGAVDVVIDTRTLMAGDKLSEDELRGSSFFAIAKYPQM